MNAALAGASRADSLMQSGVVHMLTPEGQAVDKQNKEDIERLKRNNFGPSKAEQERMVADALAQVRAQSAGALSEQQRMKAAQPYRAPDTTTAQIVQGAQRQAGTLRMQAADQAAQLARQAKLDALARVAARDKKTTEDVQSIRNEAHEAYMGSSGGKTGNMDEDGQALPSAYGMKRKKRNKSVYDGSDITTEYSSAPLGG